jgi:hypothetical protein
VLLVSFAKQSSLLRFDCSLKVALEFCVFHLYLMLWLLCHL